jgi:hypothetical protein
MIVKLSKLFRPSLPTMARTCLTVPSYRFSEGKEDDNKKEKGRGFQEQLSMSDLWQGISKYSESAYNELKKLSKFNWAVLLSLPVLYYLLRKEEAEEYAINYF